MGIKGKRRSRGGARTGGPAPKPRVEQRRTPLWRRRSTRRGAAAVLVALAVWGGLLTWGRVSRANRLRAYDGALAEVLAGYTSLTTAEGDPERGMPAATEAFVRGEVTPQALEDLATKVWEKQFAEARDAVRKLRPPDEARVANSVIAQGIDLSIGAARLWVAVAEQRALANATRDRALRRKLEAHVELLVQHARDYQIGRAQATFDVGLQALADLRRAWGTATAPPA